MTLARAAEISAKNSPMEAASATEDAPHKRNFDMMNAFLAGGGHLCPPRIYSPVCQRAEV
jgi:hypothetical protein